MKNNQSLCNILKIPRHPEAHIRLDSPVSEAVPVACLHTDSDASLFDYRLRLGGDKCLPVHPYAVKPRVISAHPRLIRAVRVGFLCDRNNNGSHAVFGPVRAQKNGVRACPYNRKPYRVRPHGPFGDKNGFPNCYGVMQCVRPYNHFRCVTKMVASGHVGDEEAHQRPPESPYEPVSNLLCHFSPSLRYLIYAFRMASSYGTRMYFLAIVL